MTEGAEPAIGMREFRQREQDQLSLLWILAVLLRERRTILSLMALGIGIALLITLLRPPGYTTTFSFVPQSIQDPSRSGLANLAGQFGLSLGNVTGEAQSPQFYADLLETREILEPVASDSFAVADPTSPRVWLPEFLGIRGASSGIMVDNTVRRLRDRIIRATAASRTTGVVTVTVRTESPNVSLGIAQRVLAGLHKFNLVTRQRQAAAERRFVEGRLMEARAALRAAEDALQAFLQSNRVANSPQLTFQQERLQRQVGLKQQILAGLEEQYENAQIREVRDTPVITTVERPAIAVRSDPRNLLINLLAGASVSLLIAVSVILLRDELERRRSGTPDAAIALLQREWKRLRRAGA